MWQNNWGNRQLHVHGRNGKGTWDYLIVFCFASSFALVEKAHTQMSQEKTLLELKIHNDHKQM